MKNNFDQMMKKMMAYYGMICEIKAKCYLMISKIRKEQEEGSGSEKFDEYEGQIKQMKKDLNKYSKKITKIQEGLIQDGYSF